MRVHTTWPKATLFLGICTIIDRNQMCVRGITNLELVPIFRWSLRDILHCKLWIRIRRRCRWKILSIVDFTLQGYLVVYSSRAAIQTARKHAGRHYIAYWSRLIYWRFCVSGSAFPPKSPNKELFHAVKVEQCASFGLWRNTYTQIRNSAML